MPLIINADDFGASESINNSILRLHKLGIVSSATLIANSKYFENAVSITRENKKLGVGVHLCLDGPFNLGKEYRTILDKTTNQFYSVDEITRKLKKYLVNETEIYKEYCLQIEKVLDHRIRISHLDHHHHLHLFIPSLRSIVKAARKFNIPYIRSQKVLLRKNQSFYNSLYRNVHQIYLKWSINTVYGLYEPLIIDNNDNTQEYNRLLKLLEYKKSIIEIMLHLSDEPNTETVFFTSNKVMLLLLKQNIISYHNL